MSYRQPKLRHRVAPAFRAAGKFVLLSAMTFGPAGISGWAVKSVARRPLKIVLAWALEPLIRRAMRGALARWGRPAR